MKTYSIKAKDISRQWYLLDAAELPLGRLAVVAAKLLLGKDKVTASPNLDGGDYVIIVNANNLLVSGKKGRDKAYWRHSGFPGGLHKRRLEEQMSLDAAKIIEHAVRGMLPDNKLRAGRLNRLKIYADDQHQHAAQTPKKLELGRVKS